MKLFAMAFAAVLCSAALASAAERAVDTVTLDSMGLAAMRPMSNDDGMAVRGKGPLQFVFGQGYVPRIGATFHPPGSGSGAPSSGFTGTHLPSNPLHRTTTVSSPSPTNGFGLGSLNVFPSPLP